MATLRQMIDKYGQRETARIMQYEGFPVAQPRIAEAINPRRDRSAASAAKKRQELNAIAKRIDLRKYPHGVPESRYVVSSGKLNPPVFQEYRKKLKTPRKILVKGGKVRLVRTEWAHAGEAEIRSGKVKMVYTGNAPDKDYADNISWPRPMVVVPKWSVEKILTVAAGRFGSNAAVSITLYGTFVSQFGRYLPSARFSGYDEDFYGMGVTLRTLRDAFFAEEIDTENEAKGASAKDRKLIEDGEPHNPELFPGFAARWANRFHEVEWIEVNYVQISGSRKG